MKEEIRTYYVKFTVDTLHTEAIIKAYSKTDTESLLTKQYGGYKVSVLDISDEKKIADNATE